MITLRPTLTELTECYELWESSDACLNCIWQEACKARRIRMKEETMTMVNVSGDLMDNPKVAETLQPPKHLVYCVKCGWTGYRTQGPLGFCQGGPLHGCGGLLVWTNRKSIYPLCYCKVCKGDTKHKDCPNQDNPKPRAKSTWFRALRGEPIIAVGRR